MLDLLYQTGLGNRNAQGFGLFDLCEKNDPNGKMQIAAANGRWCGAKQPRCGGSGRQTF